MNIHTVEISRPLGPRLMRIFCRTQRLFQFSPSEQHNYAWKSLSDYMYAPASTRRSSRCAFQPYVSGARDSESHAAAQS